MRKILILLVALSAFCMASAPAAEPVVLNTNTSPPTLSGPFIDALGLLSTATNLSVAPYGLYRTSDGRAGGGIAALYNITPNFASGVGLDMMDSQLWMPSGQVQFQLPLVIAGTVTTTPFGYTGLSTPIGGAGDDNGTAVGIFGAGLGLKLLGDTQGRHLSLFYSIEHRTGFDGEWMRFGLYYRF